MRFFPLIFLLFSAHVLAHKDTVVRLDGDVLMGLPSDYLPATFDRNNLILSLSSKSVAFPECIDQHLPSIESGELQISASWYHDLALLPPYITFRVRGDLVPLFSIDMTKLVPLTGGFEKIDESCLSSFEEPYEVGA